jgi:hypothetical protein
MHPIIPGVDFPGQGCSGYVALQALAGGSNAISPEASAASKKATEVLEWTEQSHALFGEKAAALSQLTALGMECAELGWDGEDAAAIDPIAIRLAMRLVCILPDGVPLPEFAAEPDGSVSLDWIRSRNRIFSLSAGSSDRLAYAWLDGADRGHGVALFDGQNIPPRVLEGIKRIVGQGHAAIRAS